MKKMIAWLLILSLTLSGCTAGGQEAQQTSEPTAQTTAPIQPAVQQTDAAQATQSSEETLAPAYADVMPLPATIDVNALTDCTVSISLENGGIYEDESGCVWMDATVYTYDLYDLVDIAGLGQGSTIFINGNVVTVEQYEQIGPFILINGGLDQGGHELTTDENGVYYEIGYSDMRSWYPLGKVTLPVAPDFSCTDSSDLDADPIVRTARDLMELDQDMASLFEPQNTTIVIESGTVTQMTRIYMP